MYYTNLRETDKSIRPKWWYYYTFQAEVMEATTKYIETLENTLFGQTRTHGYPEKLKPYSANRGDDYDSIRKAVHNYVCQTMKWTGY